MFYKVLGKLSTNYVNNLESMIMELHDHSITGFQRIEFTEQIIDYLKVLTADIPLKIQHNGLRLVQKAFYSDPGITYPIHKDGIRCMSALNVAVSSNDNDWIRWYSDRAINNIGKVEVFETSKGSTRNTDIKNLEAEHVEYICEYRPKKGDVYILDVNSFHTWHCSGPSPRIIVQTKFDGFPNLNFLSESLKNSNITNNE